MERSTKFMSLSGWTGIMAGIYSLIGAIAAYWVIFKLKLANGEVSMPLSDYENGSSILYRNDYDLGELFTEKNLLLILIALLDILFSAGTAFYQSSVKAQKQGLKLWNSPLAGN